jgi:RNA-directed DNA polymerase
MRSLMDPTKSDKPSKSLLIDEVRKQQNLRIAWLHVSERAKMSKDPKTRRALAEFHKCESKLLAAICKQIGAGEFNFEPQRGVAVPRSGGKAARPIVIAPIVNRIVQRSILNVCQSKDARVRRKLGQLPAIVEQSTSVGGLPGRGVPDAVAQISSAISSGATWFVRSDLKNFFQNIPKSKIERFLEENVQEVGFCKFFMKALETELENKIALDEELDLFPIGDIGVPQGSALSALCANIVLHEFDKQLNGRGIVTIRYLDDFVILGPNRKSVESCWEKAIELLAALNLTPHSPDEGSGKAEKGQVKDGFDFLSVHFQGNSVQPSRSARLKILSEVKLRLRESKSKIQGSNEKARRAEPRFLQTLVSVDRMIRGWADAFRFTNMRLSFVQLDQKIDTELKEYRLWFGALTKNTSPEDLRRLMGVALLSDTPQLSSSLESTRQATKDLSE